MPDTLVALYVFVLACFIGYYVIWGVTPSLHTPLVALTNAISGIVIVGYHFRLAPPIGRASGSVARNRSDRTCSRVRESVAATLDWNRREALPRSSASSPCCWRRSTSSVAFW